jgi:hypothetical protein
MEESGRTNQGKIEMTQEALLALLGGAIAVIVYQRNRIVTLEEQAGVLTDPAVTEKIAELQTLIDSIPVPPPGE